MKDIVRFDLVKINRGRETLCQCTAPCFEVDEENRIVSCKICGAILDPFEALIKLAERPERLEETQRRMLEKIKTYREEAEKEYSRMIKSRVFRKMQSNYNEGLFPYCPECKMQFDPVKIDRWGRWRTMTVEEKIEACPLVKKFENPGREGDGCAGLRTCGGEGEPVSICQECELNYINLN